MRAAGVNGCQTVVAASPDHNVLAEELHGTLPAASHLLGKANYKPLVFKSFLWFLHAITPIFLGAIYPAGGELTDVGLLAAHFGGCEPGREKNTYLKQSFK